MHNWSGYLKIKEVVKNSFMMLLDKVKGVAPVVKFLVQNSGPPKEWNGDNVTEKDTEVKY